MAAYDGTIKIITKIDADNATKSFKGTEKEIKETGRQIDKARTKQKQFTESVNKTEAAAGKVTGSFKSLGGLLLKIVSIAALVRIGKQAVELASSITEVDNVVQKAFGNMRDQMDALAETSIKTLGMSRLTAYKTGSTFMSMGKSMLSSADDAATMAIELTKLTGNMASFYNVEQDLAAIALKSIYTGETETLKQYGVVMTETNLKEFALANGITKAYSEMTQSEKVMLRYNYVMKQLSFIGDDFLDTQDSWANQTRILSEQWKELLSVIGSGLITVLTPLIKVLNNIVSELTVMAQKITDAITKIFGLKQQTINGAGIAEEYGEATDAADEYTEAVKKANNANSGFDELNIVGGNNTSTAAGGNISLADVTGDAAENMGEIEEQTTWLDNMLNKLTPIIAAFEHLNEVLEPIKQNVGEGLKSFYNDVLTPLADWVLNDAVPAYINYISDAMESFNSIWESFKPIWQLFANDVLEPLASWTGGAIVSVLNGLGLILKKVAEIWNNEIMPIINKLAEIYIEYFEPVINNIIAGTTKLWEESLKPFIDQLTATINELWQDVLKPLVLWVIDSVGPDIAPVIEFVANLVINAVKGIVNIFTSMFKIIQYVIRLISALFKGDWATAWQTAKDIIKNPINAIIGMVEKMVNGIINGINKGIDALNSFSVNVPDWVPGIGGHKFGFDLSHVNTVTLPRLANGGITTGSTLANIGEAGREAVLPLENNLQYLAPLADMINSKMGAQIIPYLQQLINTNEEIANKELTIGDREIAKAALRGTKSMGAAIIS